MYAVIDIKGFQYKLEKGETLRVPRYDIDVGGKIKITDVLLLSDDKKVSIGDPYVKGVVVEATVTGHDKDKKILVFKKKRRKDYSVKKGHRQGYTEIIIDNIKTSKSKEPVEMKKNGEVAEHKETAKSASKKTEESGSMKTEKPKPKKTIEPKPKKTIEPKLKKTEKPKSKKTEKPKSKK